MSIADIYPVSPVEIPENFTDAKPSYKRQATFAMLGLMAFIIVFFLLLFGFAFITYKNVVAISQPGSGLGNFIVLFCSALLTLFMIKSLFAVRKMGTPDGIEVTREQEPKLFEFLETLADEVGAPKPHRVFITPEVNAAVFYDLSLINLIIPSKKNLIVGLGLVNVLNLTEFKAVLAHEFGHFSQNTMMVGRWVYIAQQIISHMVSVRDWLDGIVKFISGIDLRIAWIGWILQLIIWALRSLMDGLFRLVIIAERALSREMEFNADIVAVSVTGSDALINALYKLQAADQAWRTAMNVANQAAAQKKLITDLFEAQSESLKEMRRVLDDSQYGLPPAPLSDRADHRVFEEETARPPQMWSTHPPNVDREQNAKATYVSAQEDPRSAWAVFTNAENLRQKISRNIYNAETTKEFESATSREFVTQNFNNASYSPEYRGAYMGRSPVREFASIDQMRDMATLPPGHIDLENLYPETIRADLRTVRSLEQEIATLEALASGQLKPSGGVIRHRGEDLHKSEIPEAIEDIVEEKKHAVEKLMVHEANCRATYQNIAAKYQNGWPEYLTHIIEHLHSVDHMAAVTSNERNLLVNTWNVITADGKIGHFERKRILLVCKHMHKKMSVIAEKMKSMSLPPSLLADLKVENWEEACPQFNFPNADKNNWPDWCQAALQAAEHFEGLLRHLHDRLLEDLLNSEASLKSHFQNGTQPEPAPQAGQPTRDYPILLSGDEHILQTKLDLWNRFQLAHGFFPAMARTVIALTIVGGTILVGLKGI